MGKRRRLYGKKRRKSAFKKDNEPDWDKLNVNATSKNQSTFKPFGDEEKNKKMFEAQREHYKKHGAPGSAKKVFKDIIKHQKSLSLKDRVDAVKEGYSPDNIQAGLSGAGLVFPQADALNAGISAVRAGYAKVTGDTEGAKKHAKNLIWNTAAITPGFGEMATATKAGKLMKATKRANQITDAIKTSKDALKGTGKIKDMLGLAGNVKYWEGTGKHLIGK